ncbi:hypothetical protein [Deinococcus roseus]|uniref:Uncharacterized protein n=1 Tax=Deinococcus roseus TaxID=392414 RepID=A0ABQ2D0U0_9DEIO|nr:hypothetical protein [Deinococcus roseus]GGJ33326.1 hypothetical protein GCM10008938_19510 [Deinococcus roseus]
MNTLLDEFIAARSGAVPHFFNGRALSAEDLKRLYAALDNLDQRFGLLHGSGVAEGLKVTLQNQTLKITPGWGFNRLGTPLVLDSEIQLNIHDIYTDTEDDDGEFRNCNEGIYVSDTVQKDRVYVLTVTPRSRLEGRAPMFGMGGAPSKCNYKDQMPGVVFRLHRWPDAEKAIQNAVASQQQNLLAHFCYGTRNPTPVNPLQDDFWPELVLPDPVRDWISSDEEPLTLLHTRTSGWVLDGWAVRRSLFHALQEKLNLSQNRARNHAMLQQYHEQLGQLVANVGGDPGQITANAFDEAFAFLPPTGILPAQLNTGSQATLSRSGTRRMMQEALNSGEGFSRTSLGYWGSYLLDFSQRWAMFTDPTLYWNNSY